MYISLLFVCQYCTEAVLPQLREREPLWVGNDFSQRRGHLWRGRGKAVYRWLLPGTLFSHHRHNIYTELASARREKKQEKKWWWLLEMKGTISWVVYTFFSLRGLHKTNTKPIKRIVQIRACTVCYESGEVWLLNCSRQPSLDSVNTVNFRHREIVLCCYHNMVKI